MPIEIIPGQAAYGSLSQISRYPNPERDPERYLPYPTIDHRPAFQIRPDDRIFTIGSCFARNIERALIQLGFNVLSSFIDGLAPDENITNKYTPPSIRQDLDLVTSEEITHDVLKRTIYRVPNGGFVNLAFGGGGALKPQPEAELLALSQRYYETFCKVREADVIVLTLGLVEVWYDRERGLYLNIAPTRAMVAEEPERFEVRILDFNDITTDLEAVYATIKARCKQDARMLLTVSSVPLHATFRGQDCLQANMYSKCLLRTAAEHFCARHKEVAYFPSFEMVMLADPDRAWIERDFRHVQSELIERIMRNVMSHYVENDLPPTKWELQQLSAKKRHDDVIRRVEEYLRKDHRPLGSCASHIQYYYGVALHAVGRHQEAVTALTGVVKLMPRHARAKEILEAAQQQITHAA